MSINYNGSRNYVSEHVYDAIWECEEGTRIVVSIGKNNDVSVEQYKFEDR